MYRDPIRDGPYSVRYVEFCQLKKNPPETTPRNLYGLLHMNVK